MTDDIDTAPTELEQLNGEIAQLEAVLWPLIDDMGFDDPAVTKLIEARRGLIEDRKVLIADAAS